MRRKKHGKNDARYWQSAAYNQELALIYEDWLMGLALSRFRWEGLPDTCDARYLEWTLMTNGVATIARRGDTWYSAPSNSTRSTEQVRPAALMAGHGSVRTP